LLQRAWSRDYIGFYTLLSQLETGIVQIDEPVHSLILEYKRIFSFVFLTVGSWQARTLILLTKTYTSITPEKAAEYLGLSSDVIVQGIPSFFKC
jgi:hypothetical protein